MPREIKVTNTITGKKEPLKTRVPGKLTMYSCGPTVYNLIHVGNLRAALGADMFFRYFRKSGYDVTYVRNYTDVDDKIINRAREEGIGSEALADKYVVEVEKDYAVAGLAEPTHKTRVTTHMPEIVVMIEKIIANGKGYVVDGEVFFSVASFEGYGKLSHRKIDELLVGARVEINEKKRSPLDFSLWKPAKPGEPFWESPWGRGRPGWHIECSAMASKWLGDQIDVHHGGEDLIFPHHENEIAQSEAACCKAPYVGYWLHTAFLTVSKEKMSKSLGNFFLARDFLTRFSGEVARYMLLSAHYRSVIDFGDEALEQALTGLHRIYEAKNKAVELKSLKRAMPDLRAESLWGGFAADCEKTRKEMDDAFANDFSSPAALGALFSLIREFNRVLAEPLAQATPAAILGAQELIRVIEEELGEVLGVGRQEPKKALEDIARMRQSRRLSQEGDSAEGTAHAARPTEQEILSLIQQRKDARSCRDFAKADEIRKNLETRGVVLKDGPAGTSWEYC